MNKNKQILQYCPNFYKIINFEFYEDDTFTENLINIYQNFVFSVEPANENDLKKVCEIDTILSKYIDDYIFRKQMKYELLQVKLVKDQNLLDNLVNSIIGIFEKIKEGQTRKIYISRWI